MDMIVVSEPGHLGETARYLPSARVPRSVKQVLFVDPDPAAQSFALRSLQFIAEIEVSARFADARARCLTAPPDLLFTNVRLGSHNGLHLLYLLKSMGAHTRCVVYGTGFDLALTREMQDLGAFIIWTPSMPVSLQSFVTAKLPPRDRRDPAVPDRRRTLRGGRRIGDG